MTQATAPMRGKRVRQTRTAENSNSRASLAKRRWGREVAPQSVGAGLSVSIWWPFASKLWCQSSVGAVLAQNRHYRQLHDLKLGRYDAEELS